MGSKNRLNRTPKIERDNTGEFYWETFSVAGQQKRRKIRNFVECGGKVVSTEDLMHDHSSTIGVSDVLRLDLM